MWAYFFDLRSLKTVHWLDSRSSLLLSLALSELLQPGFFPTSTYFLVNWHMLVIAELTYSHFGPKKTTLTHMLSESCSCAFGFRISDFGYLKNGYLKMKSGFRIFNSRISDI